LNGLYRRHGKGIRECRREGHIKYRSHTRPRISQVPPTNIVGTAHELRPTTNWHGPRIATDHELARTTNSDRPRIATDHEYRRHRPRPHQYRRHRPRISKGRGISKSKAPTTNIVAPPTNIEGTARAHEYRSANHEYRRERAYQISKPHTHANIEGYQI